MNDKSDKKPCDADTRKTSAPAAPSHKFGGYDGKCQCDTCNNIRATISNQTLGESDKQWLSFEEWLISTPFPQDSQKIVAKILKKTCGIRESLRTQENKRGDQR